MYVLKHIIIVSSLPSLEQGSRYRLKGYVAIHTSTIIGQIGHLILNGNNTRNTIKYSQANCGMWQYNYKA